MTQFTDLYFKVADMKAFDAMARSLGWIDAEGNAVEAVSLIRIDDLCLTPGAYDEEGKELTPPEMDGPHVNVRVRGEAPKAFDFAGVEQRFPANPRHVWF